jgi:two-component system copper resistance phosphate regulon response regulator CusR
MRILIVEDDAALASFVKKGLEAEHYAVDVSGDGEQARAMAGEFDYDLLMLDLSLPHLDGVSILRYLRTRKPSMPILVLTGRNRVEERTTTWANLFRSPNFRRVSGPCSDAAICRWNPR